ncbi:MAG: hypothetical protein NZ553_02035 [Caldilinea sp.]|nr:hypothetical protein [Caldilinea sp.]MDW8439230.1 hypothetical protein [Caldilineaceae bacterium]
MSLNRIHRIFFGGVIGLLAGFSFHMAVLPFVAEHFLPEMLDALYTTMGSPTLWVVGVWAAAGALAAWWGGARRGSMIFGAGGLLAGALLGGIMAWGSQSWGVFLTSAAAGWLYGWGAGLLVGGGFGPAAEG